MTAKFQQDVTMLLLLSSGFMIAVKKTAEKRESVCLRHVAIGTWKQGNPTGFARKTQPPDCFLQQRILRFQPPLQERELQQWL
jgi:hypothetical protein